MEGSLEENEYYAAKNKTENEVSPNAISQQSDKTIKLHWNIFYLHICQFEIQTDKYPSQLKFISKKRPYLTTFNIFPNNTRSDEANNALSNFQWSRVPCFCTQIISGWTIMDPYDREKSKKNKLKMEYIYISLVEFNIWRSAKQIPHPINLCQIWKRRKLHMEVNMDQRTIFYLLYPCWSKRKIY